MRKESLLDEEASAGMRNNAALDLNIVLFAKVDVEHPAAFDPALHAAETIYDPRLCIWISALDGSGSAR